MGVRALSEVVTPAEEGAAGGVMRAVATPALLAVTMVAWVALWAAGVPSIAASLLGSIVIVAGLLFLEHVTPRPGLDARPAGTLRSDIAFTATTTIVAMVVPALVVVPLARMAASAIGVPAVWPTRLPLWLNVIAAVLFADFMSYWWHRLQHTTGDSWLWRLHSVHHSPRHYDFWMGARVHPFDVVGFTLVGYGVLALLGAPPLVIEIAAFFAAMVGAVHHTSVDTDCGWLNRVVPFADHHIVHHSIAPRDAGNYGNITTLFDQVFATYRIPTPRDSAPVGAWSLADDYPQGAYFFQMFSPFGRFWQRAIAKKDPSANRELNDGDSGTALGRFAGASDSAIR